MHAASFFGGTGGRREKTVAVEMRNASDRTAAEDFITFLTSPTAKAAFAANGVN